MVPSRTDHRQQLFATLGGLGLVGLFHRAKAANIERKTRKRNNGIAGRIGQPGQHLGHICLVLLDQRALHAALCAAPEWIERRAAQPFQPRQNAEIAHHRRTVFLLHRASVRTGLGQHRRSEMEFHREIALELFACLCFGVQMQAGDLVFVLVGEQLVIALCDGLFYCRITDAIDQLAIAFGQTLALVLHQMVRAISDPVFQRLGQLHHRRGNQTRRLFGMQHRPAPDVEGALVLVDSRPVQIDGPQDRVQRQRHQPALPGRAKDHHVGKNRIPHGRARQFRGIEHIDPPLHPGLKRHGQPIRGQRKFGVAGEIACDDLVAVDHRARAPLGGQAQRLCPRTHHQIAPDQRVRLARGDAYGADVAGGIGQTAMDVHRTALLRQSGHFHHAGALAVDMGGLGHHRANGDNACAANPGDDDIPRPVDRRQVGHRQVRQVQRGGCLFLHLRPFEGHEGRAESLEAGEILVAAGLIDRPLATQFGFCRYDGHAIGLHPAIAAALADIRVDEHAPVDIRERAALAAAAFFGGAGLHIDNDADTLGLGETLLNGLQFGAFGHRNT